ncbi:Asp/Glu racemase [Parasponia andersonii]|uniref:Asp/Glu racemase n=1 Tax=Parasponia andersonii TaxID=3476 RepID=A0A2P5DYR0_PARAD|nr:Asp/Glu racemase [Parasponia andersonii]
MKMSLQNLYSPPVLVGLITKNRTHYGTRPRSPNHPSSVTVQVSSIQVQNDQSGDSPEPIKVLSSGIVNNQRERSTQTSDQLLSQPNTIGIIGGVSAFSTLIFLEKLVWWGSRAGGCPPFVVCSDSTLCMKLPLLSSFPSFKAQMAQIPSSSSRPVVESLKHKRVFLELSGARCIVMPCHILHVWHSEISEGCPLPFLHAGECVAKELLEAKLKPLEVGSDVRIGILASNEALVAGFYQDKLQDQGFEVVLPDKATMEHVVIPAMEALKRGDKKGARNLLKVAVQILLMRAVNTVIIACDEMKGLLPHDDPLLQKCTDPMDALARSTIKWAKSEANMQI